MMQDLVNVIIVEPLIKKAVEVAEEVDDLVCSAVRCDVGEANNVAEKDGRVVEHLELYYKENRCLARYSPRATTTSQPTNRAPNEPGRPGLK